MLNQDFSSSTNLSVTSSSRDGLKLLNPSLSDEVAEHGYSFIAAACVNYLQVGEL
jgi:hypothetical protein